MENQTTNLGRKRRAIGSFKEGLSDIRDRIENNKGMSWKKMLSFATALGTIGAMALSRRLFEGHTPSSSPNVKTKTKTKSRSRRIKVKR